ncbi:MAG: T9SS type A sorting domain-containing protein [Bacteroidota bacterium]
MVHSQCTQFIFVTGILPDSICVFGVEGDGDPVAGCYPDPDMCINIAAFLDVTWGELHAAQDGFGNRLRWTTLSETNNDYFQVERARDKLDFRPIGEVAAQPGDGPHTYRYFDPNPLPGANFYRLRQVDRDGQFSYSEVFDCLHTPTARVTLDAIVPLPDRRLVDVHFQAPPDAVIAISLYDLNGRHLLRRVNEWSHSDILTLDLSRLPAGAYFLSLHAEGEVVQKRFFLP